MKKRNFTVIFVLLLTCIAAVGQVKIKGKVFDDKKETIIGASIIEKGTKNGTVTDIDGNFSLLVSNPKGTLVISYIGMKSETLPLSGKTDIVVTMESSSVELQEVVAVGYGTMRKSDLTGSVSSVKVKDTETTPTVSVDQMLKGKSSGVYVNTGSAEPGGVSTVKIRGVNSLTGNTEPLYVVDGVVIESVGSGPDAFNRAQQKTNPLTYLSPQDIVNIEVLKDASATAIFGSRGANGVILITTKSGEAGTTKVNISSSMNISQPRKFIPMLSGPDYARYRNELALLEGRTTLLYGMTPGTSPEELQWKNWQEEVLQTAYSTTNRVAISGGTKSSNYYLSSGIDLNQGIVRNTSFSRGDVRFNFNNDLTDKIKLSFNIAAVKVGSQMTQTTGSGGTTNFSAIRSMISKNPILNFTTTDDTDSQKNLPTAWVNDYKDNNIEASVQSKLGLTFQLSKIFSYEIRASYNYKAKERNRYYGRTLSDFAKGAAGFSNVGYSGYNIDNLLNFNHTINKQNRISGVMGVTYSADDLTTLSYYATGFDKDLLGYEQIGDATDIGQRLKRTRYETKLNSYLARFTYSLMDKYLLTLSGRADGSSKFANGNKIAYFPSAALAWRAKEETFLKNVESISNCKVRLGWGQTGNQAIPAFSSVSSYSTFGYSAYSYGGQIVSGKYIATLGNPDLQWETSEQINAGLDFGLFAERLSVSIDVYQKMNKQMLINRPLAPSYGYASALVNFGELENKGIDISTSLNILTGKKLKWTVDANFSVYRNKIAKLGLPIDANTGLSSYMGGVIHPIGDLNTPANIFIEGQPAGLFWGLKTNGVYQNQAQIDNFVAESAARTGNPANKNFYFGREPQVGEIIYVDKNDLHPDMGGDGVVGNASDYGVIGNPNPDFTWGANSNLSYGNWNLAIGVNGVQGKDVLNANLNSEDRLNGSLYNVSQEAWNGRWQGDGSSNYFPKPYSKTIGNVISDRLVEDASFVRLANVTLSYTLIFKKKSLIKDLKVFGTANNLVTLTNYRGYDPEVDSFGGSNGLIAIDNNSYPSSRSFIMGFTLNF